MASSSPAVPSVGSEFSRWFPKATDRSAPETTGSLLCFHAAGCAEDMFTSEGTGARRAPSPLLAWCASKRVRVLAAQAPGRGARLREEPCISAQSMAERVLDALVDGQALTRPYVVLSHSMGSWVAFELLLLARSRGLPMPQAWFLGAMPAADLPVQQRPWRVSDTLNEADFAAECREWGVNEAVFGDALWPMYQTLMRADFNIFDHYVYAAHAERPFDFPVHTYWGTRDRRVGETMIRGWGRFTTAGFSCTPVDGGHLWPLDKDAKAAWLTSVVERLEGLTF
ncbi:hypothetical protein FOA52_007648 [Chlamydomonas sp. UWO 241]|nr:hypothetical protein FOA52_007648 [Chlamydomonas sp. UWO 241]